MSYLPLDIQELIAEAQRVTELNNGSTLNVAFSYTARYKTRGGEYFKQTFRSKIISQSHLILSIKVLRGAGRD